MRRAGATSFESSVEDEVLVEQLWSSNRAMKRSTVLNKKEEDIHHGGADTPKDTGAAEPKSCNPSPS